MTIMVELSETTHDWPWQRPEVTGFRFEVIDGRMEVTRHVPGPWHQLMAALLRDYFSRVGLFALENLDVVANDDFAPTADVAVFRSRKDVLALKGRAAEVSALVAIAEIVSRGHESADRDRKMREYFSGGLPEYWLIDRLAADNYEDGIARRYVRGEAGFDLASTTKVSEL